MRLLTDPSFIEEFDTVVDEIADQYVGNEFRGEELRRVEQYFLKSTERQNKVRFAKELLRHAAVASGPQVSDVRVPPGPGFFERVRLFWARQTVSFRAVTAFATLVIVAGVALLMIPDRRTSGTYASINLTISNAARAGGAETKSVRLEPESAGIRIELNLPEQIPQAKNYRVELLDEQQASRDLPITERKAQSLVITVPGNEIKRGSYIIHLFADEQRVQGSYFFTVE